MKNFDLNYKLITLNKLKQQNLLKIHFIGIGGISMNCLDSYALINGFIVSGSDMSNSEKIVKLKQHNVTIYSNHSPNNIIDKDIIVYSNATENTPELLKAKQLNKIILSRAEFLSIILKNFKTKICVSGAHGKTTTTALIYSILKQANKQPSLHLGGNLIENGESFVFAKKDYIVCESCEYKDSFLKLKPNIGLILNISAEHLDYFKNYQNVYNSFSKFAKNSKNLITLSDFFDIKPNNTITFNFNNGNFSAKNLKINKDGTTSFCCLKNGEQYCNINLNLIGKHNVLNALASIAVADFLNIKKENIQIALKNFCGIERRFQFLSKQPLIIHDYAHHPDEILTVLTELKKFYNKKLLVVFQPHTYSRTKTLMKEFVSCFKKFKDLIIYKTYSAREKYDKKGSALTLSKNIGENCIYIKNKQKLYTIIKKKISDNYAVIFLGAGNIYEISKIVNKYVDKCKYMC